MMNSCNELSLIHVPSKSLERLTRREAMQRILAATGAALASPLAAAGAHPVVQHLWMLPATAAHAAGDVSWSPKFLSVEQNNVLVAISDRMLPGAGAAHVNRTIDLVMTVETTENRKLLTQALFAFDGQARKQLHSGITKLSTDQIDKLLSFCSEQEPLHAEHDDDSPGWKLNQRTPLTGVPNLRDHFEYLKGWIVASYYSSEVGLRELGWDDGYYFESPAECKHAEGHQ